MHPPRLARLEELVELRLAVALTSEPAARRRVQRVILRLRDEIGDSVPKTVAGRLLGISVVALDRWVAQGLLPTLRPPGASRSELETDTVLDVAEEVARLREHGYTGRLVAAAFRRLAAAGRLRRKVRPNQPAHDLRELYESTTPLERLEQAIELSSALASLSAARG
jgi:hypothetical protein